MKKVYIAVAVVAVIFLLEECGNNPKTNTQDSTTAKSQSSNVISEDSSQYSVVVKPRSSFVMTGDSFVADVYLTKKISEPADMKMTGWQGKGEKIIHQNGAIHYSAIASDEGLQTFSGTLSIKNASGVAASFPFSSEFMIAKPSASISSKYLVKGIENEIYASAAGFPPSDLQVESSDGKIVRGKNPETYFITPTKTGKCTITISSTSKSEILCTTDFEVIEKK